MRTASETRAQLHRLLGPLDGLAIVVGIVIGAGILRTPGLIAGYLGSPWLILGVWVLGGVMAGLSTVVFAEMAAMLPHAGGKYVYAREAFGPRAGFVAGWSELLVTRAFSGAAKSVVIAEYLILLVGRGSVPVLAGAVVLAFLVLHLGGLRAGKTFQNWVTVLKVLMILTIVGVGFAFGGGASWQAGVAIAPGTGLLLGFALAYQSISFTYYGWDDASKMAEEVRNPGRNLPVILLGGAAAVAVLYLLINVAFLHVLTPEEMAGSALVARDAVAAGLGEAAGVAITVAGLVILIGSLNVNFLGMPRVGYGLARDGLAPWALTRVGGRGTPTTALLLVTAIIFSLAVSGTFELLIRFMMFVAIAVDGMVLLALFRLRRLLPDAARPFRVPGYPLLPALVVAMYATILAIIIATQPLLALGGGAMIALLVAGAWRVRARTPEAAGREGG